MDILSVKTIETTVIHLRSPVDSQELFDGKTPVTITLAGMHTDAFQLEITRQQQEDKQRDKRGQTKSPLQERIDTAKLYASVTKEWTGISKDGKPVECNLDNAIEIYKPESMAWLRKQISDALRELAGKLTA